MRKFASVGKLAIVGLLVLTSRRSDSIEWLTKSPVPRRWLAFSGPWIQPVRIQLARLKQWILGPRQLITINAMIVELTPAAVSELASRPSAVTNDAGACAFLIENKEEFRRELLTSTSTGKTNKLLSSPSMMTADGMQAQMASYETVSIGTSTNIQKANVGWWLDVWPRASGHSTDLACFLTHTERAFERVSPSTMEVTNLGFIRTNASLGARVRIPAIPAPQPEFKTAEEAVKLSLEWELTVTRQINDLVDLSISDKDHISRNFLQWFVSEQLEEVASMETLLSIVRRAGESGLLFVEDYLTRRGGVTLPSGSPAGDAT